MANPHWNTTAAQQVRTVYLEVIDNVISNMRQTFLDDGTDEQVLQDLKAAWMLKLEQANTLVPLHNPLAAVKQEASAAASGDSFYPHNVAAGAAAAPAAGAKAAADVKPKGEEAASANADAGPSAGIPQTDGADGSGEEAEEELNSQDEESGEESEGEEGSANFIICQWDKINRRNRSRWRANLRHGIMHIDGKDFMFQKLTGEYDW